MEKVVEVPVELRVDAQIGVGLKDVAQYLDTSFTAGDVIAQRDAFSLTLLSHGKEGAMMKGITRFGRIWRDNVISKLCQETDELGVTNGGFDICGIVWRNQYPSSPQHITTLFKYQVMLLLNVIHR